MKRTEIRKEFRKTTGFAPRLERNFVPDLEKAFPKTFRNECDLRERERENRALDDRNTCARKIG
jgi:hypothetical protein